MSSGRAVVCQHGADVSPFLLVCAGIKRVSLRTYLVLSSCSLDKIQALATVLIRKPVWSRGFLMTMPLEENSGIFMVNSYQ